MLDQFDRDEGIKHFQRGLALERANRIGEAVEEYRLAIANDPYLREAHVALGLYYRRSGLLAKAAETFHTVATLEGDFLAHFNLAYVLVELERYEEALSSFEACLALEPDDAATHYQLAYVYFCLEEYQQAIDYLRLPQDNYPEDWEIYNLLGKCYLGLRAYDESQAAFGQALMLVNTMQGQTELLDSITKVERFREFRSLNSIKDQLYANDGVVYLGSAQDNGLVVADVQDYHFTYPDIGITLQRLLALRRAYRWNFTAVVPLDTLAQPLARALAELLGRPVCSHNELKPNDTALLVMAVAHEAELLILTSERVPCRTIAFCLGLNWLRYNNILPQLIGMIAHGSCSVPWEADLRRMRADNNPPAQIEACLQHATTQTLLAFRNTPNDSNLPRQIRYYTRNHRRLSFSTF